MNTQPLVTLVPWTMIAQFLNLMIQLFLIKKFLFKPVNDILEKRRALTDQAIREAREAKEKADGLKTQYESGIAKAREEAARIAREKAEREARHAREKAEREARARDRPAGCTGLHDAQKGGMPGKGTPHHFAACEPV